MYQILRKLLLQKILRENCKITLLKCKKLKEKESQINRKSKNNFTKFFISY